MLISYLIYDFVYNIVFRFGLVVPFLTLKNDI